MLNRMLLIIHLMLGQIKRGIAMLYKTNNNKQD